MEIEVEVEVEHLDEDDGSRFRVPATTEQKYEYIDAVARSISNGVLYHVMETETLLSWFMMAWHGMFLMACRGGFDAPDSDVVGCFHNKNSNQMLCSKH